MLSCFLFSLSCFFQIEILVFNIENISKQFSSIYNFYSNTVDLENFINFSFFDFIERKKYQEYLK